MRYLLRTRRNDECVDHMSSKTASFKFSALVCSEVPTGIYAILDSRQSSSILLFEK